MTITVLAPHPDDDIIGCGGSIIKFIKTGYIVNIVYLTSGESGDAKVSKPKMQEIREKEAQEGAKTLGVTDLTFLRFADGNLEYSAECAASIARIFRKKKPDIIMIPHEKDAHPDHRTSYRIIMDAVYKAGANAFPDIEETPWNISTVLAYEVWTPLMKVNLSVDISIYIDQKLKALKAHKSQLKSVDYNEAVKGLNRYRGATTGKGKYAECFEVIKIDPGFIKI